MPYVLRIVHVTDASPRWGTPFAQTIYRDGEFPDARAAARDDRDLSLGVPLKCHCVLLLLKGSPSNVELLTCGRGGVGDVMGERTSQNSHTSARCRL